MYFDQRTIPLELPVSSSTASLGSAEVSNITVIKNIFLCHHLFQWKETKSIQLGPIVTVSQQNVVKHNSVLYDLSYKKFFLI